MRAHVILPFAFATLGTLGTLGLACSKDDAPAASPDSGVVDSATDGSSACTSDGAVEPKYELRPVNHTPRWAFLPWISKDISDRADTYAFVGGFQDRDIPVGTVVLDSPWETHYNTFVPSPSRYGDFPSLVSDMGKKGVKVVLWITSMVNESAFDLEPGGDKYFGESPNYFEGQSCHYFVNDGQTYSWWKGVGASVDFFDPRALYWWHRQQDLVLTAGIAGWKLDFGESYIDAPVIKTAAGDKTLQQYSEQYYRDFLTYGLVKGGPEFTTMVRPYDESYGFKGRFYATKLDAPVGWVGDNRRDWVGLVDALDEIFRSAKAGYVVLGSDIGGYLDRDDKTFVPVPASTLTFARWTAMGALMPFMELHGRANLTPWTVDDHVDETVKLYRYWSKLHAALVPFFYSLAEEAYAGGKVIVRPVTTDEASWVSDYRYQLGDAFLVAPVLDDKGIRDIPLPSGAKWYDWFAPTNDALAGGTTLSAYDSSARERFPLFLREGAIVPLDVVDDVNGLGTVASKGALTVLVYPSAAKSTFVVHDEDGKTTTIDQSISGAVTTVHLSRAHRPIIVRARSETAVTAVSVDGSALTAAATRAAFDAATTGFFVDSATKALWIKLPASDAAQTMTW